MLGPGTTELRSDTKEALAHLTIALRQCGEGGSMMAVSALCRVRTTGRALSPATGRRLLSGFAVIATLGIGALSLALMTPGKASAIIGGTLDGNGHPNVAYVVAVDAQGAGLFSCSGTLVAPAVV